LLLLLLLLSSGASVLQIHHLPGTLDVGKGRFLLPFTPLASTLRTLPQSRAVLFAAVWQEQASSERPDDFNRCIVRARPVVCRLVPGEKKQYRLVAVLARTLPFS
jgi:hypothetical protein